MKCIRVAAVAVTLATAFLGGNVLSHTHTAYAHDATIAYKNPDWMGALDDDLPVSRLSAPGTHNSMSFYGGDIVATQTMPLTEQMNAGVRVFDIRLRASDNRFAIHHGLVYQHAGFGDVLDDMVRFLQQHPAEVLFVRVREEYQAQTSTLSFREIFSIYAAEYRDYIAKESYVDRRLGDLRGKIVFLPEFFGYGINYRFFNIQDDFTVSTNWDLYRKWEAVKRHLQEADAQIYRPAINYLSASGGSFPYFVASGHSSHGTNAPRLATGLTTPGWRNSYPDFPRVACFFRVCTIAFEGTNVLTYEYIRANKPRYVGFVMADFPGGGLIDAIIQTNFNAGTTN